MQSPFPVSGKIQSEEIAMNVDNIPRIEMRMQYPVIDSLRKPPQELWGTAWSVVFCPGCEAWHWNDSRCMAPCTDCNCPDVMEDAS